MVSFPHLTRGIAAAVAGLAIALIAGAAEATPVTIFSGQGTGEACASAPLGQSDGCVAITPHSLWQPNDPAFLNFASTPAEWISVAKTGVGPDNVLMPPDTNPTLGRPDMVYTLSFAALANSTITTKVWADDTARVIVDGAILNTPVLDPAQNGPCEHNANGQTPGCIVNAGLQFSGTLDAAAFHTLEIDVWQIGTGSDNNSNPFGLMYVGQIQVPEPGTAALFALALGGIALAARGRRRRAAYRTR